jgi:decaprenylphospho-beta-D-erythro-pentofuranosid-2-ulose 2-reductase
MRRYKHAIVVGGSSGIGAELVMQLADRDCRVAAVARRGERLEAIVAKYPELVIPIVHDVTNFDEVPGMFQEITRQLGGLDLIIYAAGVMPEVEVDEYDFEKDRLMIETNLLGAIAWLNQAAIRFQQTKHGTIIGIGSVAGDRGRMKQPVYNATKAGLATYLEALRNRLSRHGVVVSTVKPGPVRTEMTKHMTLKNALSPYQAAELVLKKSRRTGEHYLVPQHWAAFLIIRNIPSWIFRRLSI